MNKTFYLQTDASDYALGVIIYQLDRLMDSKEESTQTTSYQFPDKEDVCLQTNLVKPFFLRVKKGNVKIMYGSMRPITSRRRRPNLKKLKWCTLP